MKYARLISLSLLVLAGAVDTNTTGTGANTGTTTNSTTTSGNNSGNNYGNNSTGTGNNSTGTGNNSTGTGNNSGSNSTGSGNNSGSNSTGSTGYPSSSCAARTDPICTFTDSLCCSNNGRGFDVYFNDGTVLSCEDAKTFYSTAASASYSDSECSSARSFIETAAGVSCDCAADLSTDAPTGLGPCMERANASAYEVCSFLPEGRTFDECCPLEHAGGIPTESGPPYETCGEVYLALSDERSALWSDAECERVSQFAIPARAFELDGCVCPGDSKLDTGVPTGAPIDPSVSPSNAPTPAPTVSSASSMTLSGIVASIIALIL